VGVDTAATAIHLVDLYSAWGFEHRGVIHWPGKTYDSVVMVHALARPSGLTAQLTVATEIADDDGRDLRGLA
jgi:hypothetical protein